MAGGEGHSVRIMLVGISIQLLALAMDDPDLRFGVAVMGIVVVGVGVLAWLVGSGPKR